MVNTSEATTITKLAFFEAGQRVRKGRLAHGIAHGHGLLARHSVCLQCHGDGRDRVENLLCGAAATTTFATGHRMLGGGGGLLVAVVLLLGMVDVNVDGRRSNEIYELTNLLPISEMSPATVLYDYAFSQAENVAKCVSTLFWSFVDIHWHGLGRRLFVRVGHNFRGQGQVGAQILNALVPC